MIDAMKSVTPNALFEPRVRSGIYRRSCRQGTMKPGIKYRHLPDLPDKALDNLNPLKLSAVMQRREGSDAGDHAFYLWSYQRGFVKSVASVNDTMTNHLDRSGARHDRIRTAPQSLEHLLNSALTVRYKHGAPARRPSRAFQLQLR